MARQKTSAAASFDGVELTIAQEIRCGGQVGRLCDGTDGQPSSMTFGRTRRRRTEPGGTAEASKTSPGVALRFAHG